MRNVKEKEARRAKRKKHIRKDIQGSSARPRMTVYRSNKHIYVQAIDDSTGKTIASVSSMEKEFNSLHNNRENAGKLGEVMGDRLKAAKIKEVVFDRNGYLYHGIVKAVADGARKSGIIF
ncbi:MAG: 50S ribosomal protein L18 [Spirochaetales bacterium]|nr:50S ribosomal protein L18 [Spirochaetales bacterium]